MPACRSRRSVGVVCRHPVIAIAPALCIEVSFETATLVPFLRASVSSSALGVPQTSTVYSILGIAMVMNILRTYLGVRPHDGATTLLI
jgi:hypothetical protein